MVNNNCTEARNNLKFRAVARMLKSDSWSSHNNRRDQDEEGLRRNIKDGLSAEKSFACLVIDRGLGLILPSKVGDLPYGDNGDSIVVTNSGKKISMSIKASRMHLPVVCVCADQMKSEKSNNFAFFFIKNNVQFPFGAMPVGWTTKKKFLQKAKLVRKGELIFSDAKFTAHYDLLTFPVEALSNIEEFLNTLTEEESISPR